MWVAPFTVSSPRAFAKLMTVLRREGAEAVHRSRPWSLPLEDRALLVATYWRTNLTMRQLAPSSRFPNRRRTESAFTMLALQPRKRFAKDTVLIVDGTLTPTRDHAVATHGGAGGTAGRGIPERNLNSNKAAISRHGPRGPR